MHANVPQYIDIEDKIAFGLTAKQLFWMGGMVSVLFLIYTVFDRQAFFLIGFFVVVLFCSFAFWQPQGVSLITFFGFVLQFFLKPRSYIWKRDFKKSGMDLKKAVLIQRSKMEPHVKEKHLPKGNQLQRIAWMLDTKK